jgi:hypothetical protein
MKDLRRYLLIGLFIALGLEFLFCFVARFRPAAFLTVLIFYPVYFSFTFLISRALDRRLRSSTLSMLVHYILFGGIGLWIEWTFLGNAPSSNPNASQVAMLSFWVAYALVPRMLLDPRAQSLERPFLRLYATYLFLGALTVLAPPPARMVLVVVMSGVVFLAMHAFYVLHWRLSRAREDVARGQPARHASRTP